MVKWVKIYQFKSGNAEFRWAKLSVTAAGSATQLNGATDLHLEGYNVRIKVDGQIVREELTKEAYYNYTYDKNKKDNNKKALKDTDREWRKIKREI